MAETLVYPQPQGLAVVRPSIVKQLLSIPSPLLPSLALTDPEPISQKNERGREQTSLWWCTKGGKKEGGEMKLNPRLFVPIKDSSHTVQGQSVCVCVRFFRFNAYVGANVPMCSFTCAFVRTAEISICFIKGFLSQSFILLLILVQRSGFKKCLKQVDLCGIWGEITSLCWQMDLFQSFRNKKSRLSGSYQLGMSLIVWLHVC